MVSLVKSFVASIIILLTGSFLYGQLSQSLIFPVKVKRGSYIRMNDSLYFFKNDTILFLNNRYLNEVSSPGERTMVFYDSLRSRAARSRLTSKLYDLVIINPGNLDNIKHLQSSTYDFDKFEGDVIRNITIERLNPFGRTVNQDGNESEGEMGGLLNRTHVLTREFILRNYLLFSSGDTISSFRLSESERLLRQLNYIDDARIIIIPVSDGYCDIHIVTKDVYSIGLTASFDGLKAGRVDLFERNLFGLGHELTLSSPYNYNKDYPPGFGISYKASNISKSLIDGTLSYYNAFGKEYYDATFSRKFLTAFTKYAGGFSVRETYTSEDLDTLQIPEPLEFNNLDAWIGRSFLLSDDEKTRAVFSARYINNNVFRRPEISSTSYRSLQKYKLYLASFSLSTQEFFKTSLIYNYRRSEDIAVGGMFQITAGREFNEFNDRAYYAVEAAYGEFNRNIGYLYARGALSSFAKDFLTEQGVVKVQVNYISNLIAAGRYKNRFFASLDFTKGFYRYEDEYLKVGDRYGIRGFTNDSVRTNERLALSLEAVTFSPLDLYGFRFVFYGFTDMVLIGRDMQYNGFDRLITEMGIGIRVRNDNLIFNTIQLRLSYFPSPPDFSKLDYFSIMGEKLLKPPDFSPGAPGIYPYR